jgi:para-nitrobenzyl esterase
VITRAPGGATPQMSEDCLSLNVWTPAADDGRRPVIIWVHGGGFVGGAGSADLYDGAPFARDGVVFVTINYRLHAFGYLYLDEFFEGAQGTGNLGVLDQVAALRWVRENIAAFGGDPDNVTLAGQSAGALSVGTILAAPAAKGLFRRAIIQSGAVQNSMPAATARRVAERVLELLDVAAGDWSALRAVSPDRIIRAASQASAELARGPGAVFGPVFDGVTRTAQPIDAIAAGSAAGVDVLLGACAEEWRFFIFGMGPEVRARCEQAAAKLFDAFGPHGPEVHRAYREAYPAGSDLDLYAAARTDQLFAIPTARLAEALLRHRPNVYMYRFSWRAPVLNGDLGACHCADLPFVFETLDKRPLQVGADPPQDLAEAMHGAWVRFAVSGDPNGDGLPNWPRFDTSQRAAMDFNTTVQVLREPAAPERRVWEGILQ